MFPTANGELRLIHHPRDGWPQNMQRVARVRVIQLLSIMNGHARGRLFIYGFSFDAVDTGLDVAMFTAIAATFFANILVKATSDAHYHSIYVIVFPVNFKS